jgi:hypothetical protein
VNLTMERNQRMRVIARVLAALALMGAAGWSHAAIDPDPSHVAAPSGDGWQILAGTSASTPASTVASKGASASTIAVPATPSSPPASTAPLSLAVTPVVLPGTATAPAGVLNLSVSPQDRNLRNALDRWLQTQGWQLAWKVDDDLPLEFNASFSGDFTSVLTQVMKATNHMRVPTRICRHTNNVIRVVARAANCQE